MTENLETDYSIECSSVTMAHLPISFTARMLQARIGGSFFNRRKSIKVQCGGNKVNSKVHAVGSVIL